MDKWKQRGRLITTALTVVMSLASLTPPFAHLANAAAPTNCAWKDINTIVCGTDVYVKQGSDYKHGGDTISNFSIDKTMAGYYFLEPSGVTSGNDNIRLANAQAVGGAVSPPTPIQAPSPPPVAPSPPSTSAAPAPPSCDIGSLTWILCPIIDLARSGVDYFTGIVKTMLEVPPLTQTSQTKDVWAGFRDLADVFFVLIFMVVVFGNSVGLDNYTVKKIMPRLIAAAILVQFSYIIVGLGVDISNVLGQGIDSLFSSLPATKTADPNQHSTGLYVVGSVAQAIGAGAIIWAGFNLGFAIPLLLIIGGAVISLITAFLTLEVRFILINFLVIISPFAFIFYVLPNTQRYFKLWHETLFKLLLMYPIIMLLLATGKLVSATIPLTDASTFQKMIVAIIPILTLFMIPATFKFAGSALGFAADKIGGMGMNRAQKGIAGMKAASAQNRQFKRQQKGLATLNALNNGHPPKGFFSKRIATLPGGSSVVRQIAQQQAGFNLGKVDERRINGALTKNDLEQLAAASRKVEIMNPTDFAAALAKDPSDYEHKAAVQKLARTGDTEELEKIYNKQYKDKTPKDVNGNTGAAATNTEWMKSLGGAAEKLSVTAPHLVHPKGTEVYKDISATAASQLGGQGLNAWSEYLATLPNGDEAKVHAARVIGRIAEQATLQNNLKGNTRTRINQLVKDHNFIDPNTGNPYQV